MPAKRIVMIGGCPRSGTTALLQHLNSSPGVFISSEENLFKMMPRMRDILGTRERRQGIAKGRNRQLSARETMSFQDMQQHTFSEAGAWPTVEFMYEWHHAQLQPGVPLVLWGDKFPNYFRQLENINLIPNAAYIHITRNPLDVVNSMIRRTEMARQGKDWWKAITNLQDMISRWSEAFSTVQKHSADPRVLHIHYEQLVFETTGTTRLLESFLDETLSGSSKLISDPKLHHERNYLNPEIITAISEHPVVKEYLIHCQQENIPLTWPTEPLA
ncbi:MAG: sulfotransferase [Halieaceae bacterium]